MFECIGVCHHAGHINIVVFVFNEHFSNMIIFTEVEMIAGPLKKIFACVTFLLF